MVTVLTVTFVQVNTATFIPVTTALKGILDASHDMYLRSSSLHARLWPLEVKKACGLYCHTIPLTNDRPPRVCRAPTFCSEDVCTGSTHRADHAMRPCVLACGNIDQS
jgi:hypothetical protein